jgi:hypothetical protein
MVKKRSQTKGVRYIANTIVKYSGKKYPKYRDALPKAREVYADIVKSGSKVTVNNILGRVRVKRGAKKDKVPKIYSKLLDLNDYFGLIDYPVYITRTTNQVWFKSKLFPEGLPDIQGGSTPSYNEYFAPFVSYINSLKGLSNTDDKLYETEWKVRCTEPIFNKKAKRWESEIISCDGTGDRFDYGFDPNNPYGTPQDLIVSQKEPRVSVSTPEPEKAQPAATGEAVDKDLLVKQTKKLEVETEKIKAETEQKRQENISNLLKMFGEGQLTKAEFKELMNKVK